MSVVCTISEKDLIILSGFTAEKMKRKLRGVSFHGKMKVMRDLQIGLAAYSAKNKMDGVQMGLLGAIQHVERLAREEFFQSRTAHIIRLNPTHLSRPSFMQTVKQQVAEEWLSTYRKYAY